MNKQTSGLLKRYRVRFLGIESVFGVFGGVDHKNAPTVGTSYLLVDTIYITQRRGLYVKIGTIVCFILYKT